jgi:hypothetical protein
LVLHGLAVWASYMPSKVLRARGSR